MLSADTTDAARLLASIGLRYRLAAAIVASVAVQLLLFFRNIDPPWPVGAAGVVKFVCTALVGAALAKTTTRPARLAPWMFIGGAVMCLIYITAYGAFVVADSQAVGGVDVGRRWVIGTSLRPGFAAHADAMMGPRDLLARGGYDPENVWTRTSLLFARLSLIVTFSLTIAIPTVGFTLRIGRPRPPE
jgi:hypothetical protein